MHLTIGAKCQLHNKYMHNYYLLRIFNAIFYNSIRTFRHLYCAQHKDPGLKADDLILITHDLALGKN